MHHRRIFAIYSGVTLLAAQGCATPCVDDGLGQQCGADGSASGTGAGTSADETGADSAQTRGQTESDSNDTSAEGSGSISATETDTAGPTTYCADEDGDGFGDGDSCVDVPDGDAPPDGHVPNADDCDDADAQAHPGAAENEPELCAKDSDDDGYGDANPGPGVDPGSDCIDDEAATFPGSAPNDDPDACMTDADDDDYGDDDPSAGATPGTDCDDQDTNVQTDCAPCPADSLFCTTDDDLAQCNANGTHSVVVEDCLYGCDDVGGACWDQLLVSAHTEACVETTVGNGVSIDATVSGGDGNYSYDWEPDAGLDDAAIEDPLATPSETTLYSLTVTDGEGNVGSDDVTIHVTDAPWNLESDCTLQTWATGVVTDYTFANGGTEACNDNNSLPNAFICPTQWQNVRINGQIWVDTAADDDTIGFVWGYQDAAHFYLLSWRELDQSTFSEGILVKRIHAEGGAATITVADLEQPVDTINSTVLALPSDFHDQGWDSSVVYDVQIDYTPTSTTIEISDGGTPVATLVINDGSYPSGRAGPYNRSQPDSCAANWTSSCLP